MPERDTKRLREIGEAIIHNSEYIGADRANLVNHFKSLGNEILRIIDGNPEKNDFVPDMGIYARDDQLVDN